MKNVIEFSKDGKSFAIKFANGKESLDIESKKEGLEVINKLIRNKKISLEEFKEMAQQIIEAKELPDKVKEEKDDFLEGLIEFMSLMMMKEMLHEICPLPDEPVKEAYLRIYEKCQKYGVIYGLTFIAGPITSKKEAIMYLEKLKKEGGINEAEYGKIKAEIEASPLNEE